MADIICDVCGTRNEPGAQFCSSCNSFLPWDETQERPAPTPDDLAAGDAGPTSGDPRGGAGPSTPRPPAPGQPPPAATSGAMRAEFEPTGIDLAPNREPVLVTVTVWNLSPIVDAYRIEAPDAPPWFEMSPAEIRLLPTTSQAETVGIRVRPGAVPPAGGTTVRLVVRSVAHENVQQTMDLVVSVALLAVPVVLLVEPSVLKVRDTRSGRMRLTVDNTAGNQGRTIRLSGRDPEGVTGFEFAPAQVPVPAGGSAVVALTLRAPVPDAGQQVTRQLTITALDVAPADGTVDADDTVEATATFIQSTSSDAPLAVRLEPALVRVRDSATAGLEVVLDNRKGSRTKRVFLTGRDQERAVRFTFAPPSLDVLPGEQVTARVRLTAPAPEPGGEVTRSVTVVAGIEGSAEVESAATFVQSTTAITVDPPVTIKLEPSQVRVLDTPTAHLQVIVDNRRGTRPRRVALSGSDPEKAVTFTFWPPLADVPPGQVARSNLRVDAPLPAPGAEYSRQITVLAADGEHEIEAAGTLLQRTSPPPPDEPLVVRLDPTVARVRNSGSATITAVADNRGGGRHREVHFTGHDAEGAVRFSFVPPVVHVPAGQWASTSVRMSAPRPDGGEQASRPITIVASDGERDAEASGSFVQESSDRRPMWRILLTILGGLLMIGGAFLDWHRGTSFAVDPQVGVQVSPNVTGMEWSVPAIDSASEAAAPGVEFIDLPNAVDPLVSAGSVLIVLAALVMLGAFGASGRLTRLAALVAAVAFAAFLIAVSLQPGTGRIGPGVFAVFAGCAIAFIGGLLARPRR